MAKTVDLRTYIALERAFLRRLLRTWRIQSAPIYQKITQACLDHKWDEARRLVPDLDMAEVGTENKEWITYMLLSCGVFGANMVARGKPSFVGVGTFDTFLKQTTNNMLQYLEHNATAQIQKDALQLIAEDEAKTKAIKFDESKHPRDGKGRFAYHGTSNELAEKILKEGLKPLSEMDRSSPIGKGFASTSEKVALSYAAMASDDSVDTITVFVFKPEASRYFQPANKHAFGPSGSWAQARSTEMSSTETVPPELIHEVRQYRLADVVEALGPQGGKQYADWESPLEDVDPVKVVRKEDQVIYVAFLTTSGPVLKWDASKHPREPKGSAIGGQFTEGTVQEGPDFTRVAITSQRPEGDPGHQANKEVFQHMHEFQSRLEALPGVTRVSVKPGVGGWDGGSESMWQVFYRGNGAARRLVAQTAKTFNQDAVLVLKKCTGSNCQPAVELSFAGGVSPVVREKVHAVLVKNGIQGWTWMKRGGKTLLRMVSVPQWGGVAEKHQKATAAVSQKLREDGLENHRSVHKVAVSVMEREGDNSYDRIIGRTGT